MPSRRALPTRATSHIPGLLTAGLLAVACGQAGAGSPSGDAAPPAPPAPAAPLAGAVEESARARIQELIEALEPIEETVTSDVVDRWFVRQQRLVGEASEGERDLGVAALAAYANDPGDATTVRRGLLIVAARAAPEDARDLLHHLMVDYGHPIDDRTEAALLLAEVAPELFLDSAREPLRRRDHARKTMPPDEFLVQGWVSACEKLGRSPVPMLADVVTNLAIEDAARHLAAGELGRFPDPLGRSALETAMIESTGNGYLRRKAAQAIRDSVPREEACELFRHVLEREVDINYAIFMRNMIDLNCR